ncbi:uncharacterized protein [Temnothorax nylanderi]|uniref:uncharacterized protein n=1 Tax=Temnothorax nylanderi TaxID=102681 RepID=UPI003A8B1813
MARASVMSSINKQPVDCQCCKHQTDKVTCSRSCDGTLCINKNHVKGVGSYHCYCLRISLVAITLASETLSGREIEFRFHHPKTEIMSTAYAKMPDLSDKRVKLQDIVCQFNFISAPDEIKQLLQSFPPKISIYDTNEGDELSLLVLDVKPLFHQEKEVKILDEKLDNAQKGKEFFREQWGKAVRELHRMKVDYQQAMQVQIKNSREELMSADLAEILSADRKALNNDQILLNELQKEIDVIKPKQPFAPEETYNQIFTTADDICYDVPCNSNKTVCDKSEEYNEQLRALREERESLLRTGNYTADDVVIKKLNAEIRSLLVSR